MDAQNETALRGNERMTWLVKRRRSMSCETGAVTSVSGISSKDANGAL